MKEIILTPKELQFTKDTVSMLKAEILLHDEHIAMLLDISRQKDRVMRALESEVVMWRMRNRN